MNFVKHSIATALAVTVLTACQGQNPFKRESNPVRNYPRVSKSIEERQGLVPYNQPQKPQAPPADNRQIICSAPFLVSVNGSVDARLLKFAEDSETKFEISVINRLGDAFKAEPTAALPRNATFREIKKTADNTTIYQLAWNPKKLAPGQSSEDHTVTLNLTSANLTSYCQGIANVSLQLLVLKSSSRPTVNVTGLPQTQIKYGEDAEFSVEVDDKTAAENNPPSLKIEFKQQAASATVIDGSAAADCSAAPQAVPGTTNFKFACKFLSSALKNANSYLNSNRTAQAVFFVSAQSNANQAVSNSHQVNIRVKFEKVQAAATTGAN